MPFANRTATIALAAMTTLGAWSYADEKSSADRNQQTSQQDKINAALPKDHHELRVAMRHLDQARRAIDHQKSDDAQITDARAKILEAFGLIEKSEKFAKTDGKEESVNQQAFEADLKDKNLPRDNTALHLALRHLRSSREALNATKDGDENRVEAKTKVNLAINQISKSLGIESEIGAGNEDHPELRTAMRHLDQARRALDQQKQQDERVADARAKILESFGLIEKSETFAKSDSKIEETSQKAFEAELKDKNLPKENKELHLALRHLRSAREALNATKEGGDNRVEAKTKVNLAISQLSKVMGVDSGIGDDKDDIKPSKKSR